MKKVLVIIATAISLGNGTTIAAIPNPPANKAESAQAADRYSKIEMKDIPEKVMQAVEKANPDCYFFEAYSSYQGGQRVYKIELIDHAGESFFIIVNEEGESIRQTKASRL